MSSPLSAGAAQARSPGDYVQDLRDYVTSPLHWDAQDWIHVGESAAVVVAAMLGASGAFAVKAAMNCGECCAASSGRCRGERCGWSGDRCRGRRRVPRR